MRSLLLVTLILCLGSLNGKAQLRLGGVEDVTFYSSSLQKNATFRVYLPPGYNPDNDEKEYPVIFMLHGATVTYEVYNFMLPIIDILWLNKRIDHFILVMPNGLAPPFNGSFYTNSVLYGNYEDFIADDLINYVDSAYHTRKSRDYRAIMGHSMGAYGAFKQVFMHPDRYCAVAGLSGPVHIAMIDMLIPAIKEENGSPPYDWQYVPGRGLTNLIFTMSGAFSPDTLGDRLVDYPLDEQGELIDSVLAKWKPHNIVEMVRRHMPETDLGIYFDCGSRDDYQLYLHNRALADSLEHFGIRHEYVEYSGDHTNGLPIRIPEALKFLDQHFKHQNPQSPTLRSFDKKTVRIYPNPASQWLYYETEDREELQEIHLLDLNGSVLQTWDRWQYRLDLSLHQTGRYHLLFKYQKSAAVCPVIIFK